MYIMLVRSKLINYFVPWANSARLNTARTTLGNLQGGWLSLPSLIESAPLQNPPKDETEGLLCTHGLIMYPSVEIELDKVL